MPPTSRRTSAPFAERLSTAPRVYAVTSGPLPRIVAVVVTFNRLDLLEKLVHRLGEIDGLAEVLVIDNNSTDRTTAVAESLGCRVVFEKENQIARARNRGASVAVAH